MSNRQKETEPRRVASRGGFFAPDEKRGEKIALASGGRRKEERREDEAGSIENVSSTIGEKRAGTSTLDCAAVLREAGATIRPRHRNIPLAG